MDATGFSVKEPQESEAELNSVKVRLKPLLRARPSQESPSLRLPGEGLGALISEKMLPNLFRGLSGFSRLSSLPEFLELPAEFGR